jgi:23S rRNA (guanine745-N1)-methyltransferase
VLSDVLAYLQCPVCGGALSLGDVAVRCAASHSFDIARQGYVSFLTGSAGPGTADTASMVQAREAFLAAGHYAPLAGRVAEFSALAVRGELVVDAGAGTAYFLRAVLERIPGTQGLALDLSKFALRRAARAGPRVAAVACDVWRPLPLRSRVCALVLDVLAPRNAAEFHRILAADGALVVVAPSAEHLAELVPALGMITVDARKEERLETALSPFFRLERRETFRFELLLSAAELESVVRMGPSAHHVDGAGLQERIAALTPPLRATASFALSLYRPLT